MSSSTTGAADCRTHERFNKVFLKSLGIIRQWLYPRIKTCNARDEILGISEEKAWKNFTRLKDIEEFTPWFMRIVQNTTRNYLRDQKLRAKTCEIFDEEQHSGTGTGTGTETELAIDIEVMLGVLSIKERAALLMSHRGYLIKEIAMEIGCTEAAAQKMISRAKQKIRKKFPEYGD